MPGGSSWKEFNTEWRDKDPTRRLFQRLGRPDWQIARRWLRHAAWPFAVAIAFGLISLWLYQAVQTLPDFFDLPLFGRVGTNAVAVAVGVALITFFALLPFSIPKADGLDLPKRFELAAILSGGVVAVAGAVFLIGEYQDQKQARITRAWDLLHKATQRAYDRMDAAEALIFENGELKDGARRNELALLKEAVSCDPRYSVSLLLYGEAALKHIDSLASSVRSCAARGNDGQLGALRTLNEAGVGLDKLRLEGIDLEGVQLPNARLQGADLNGANLIRANLSRSNLRHADLKGTLIIGADLSGTDFSFANLRGAFIDDDEIKRARICRTTLPNGDDSIRDCPR